MLIFGEITEKTAEDVYQNLQTGWLKEITLHTQGGDLNAAMAIYDAIVGKNITVIGTGMVASAGIVVLLGGDKRLGTPNARFMTHGVQLVKDKDEEVAESELAEAVIYHDLLSNIISSRTNRSKDQAIEMLDGDHFFSAEEAIEMGFINGVK